MGSVFWGVHYEAEIYKYTNTVKYGKRYIITCRMILWLISMTLLIANESIDLMVSDLAETEYLWTVTLQSHSYFRYSQINCTFGSMYALMCCSKVCSITLMCFVAEYLAKKLKTLKDTVLFGLSALIVLLFVEKGLQSTMYHGVVQLGCVDWLKIIGNTVILLPTKIPSVVLGVIVTVGAVCCWGLLSFYKNHCRWTL